MIEMPALPDLPNLRNFHLTMSSQHQQSWMPILGFEALRTKVNFSKLRSVSFSNLVLDSVVLREILKEMKVVEELYLTIGSRAVLVGLASGLTSTLPETGPKADRKFDGWRRNHLRILHFTIQSQTYEVEDLRKLAEAIPSLEQIGAGNRVYEVLRRYQPRRVVRDEATEMDDKGVTTGENMVEVGNGHRDDRPSFVDQQQWDLDQSLEQDQEEEVVVELARWSKTTTPGYFQIWRG